jgi:type II secretory ATPase GspE/PulE/Tfp pilus assembly ATPase PilB-like protein
MDLSKGVKSAWQSLKSHEITVEQALDLLIDDQKTINQLLLDTEVGSRFFRQFPDPKLVPPVIPLLLWQQCFYLGSPRPLESEEIRKLRDHTLSEIKIIPINEQSYNLWFHSQNDDRKGLTTTALIDPLTGLLPQEDISQVAELSLNKAGDQNERIRTIISTALRNRASDIHLEPSEDGLRIRYRIDGILRDITTLSTRELSRRVIVSLKVMCNMDISESRRPQDGRIGDNYRFGQDKVALDMRVSTLPCMGGEKAVIRLLPQRNPFSTVDKLGFSQETLSTYLRWLYQPQGLVILTGPTGSGKTSTLYTSLQTIAKENVNVVTVEDPVEYILPRITQTQVHEATGMTFAAGLRAILRQDPDIIMVGEIRDHDTAETAVRAALTGHLVLTTLHTNDAISAIPRLKDIGPDPGLISDALLGIVAQRLVRKVCPHCGEPYTPKSADLSALKINPDQIYVQGWRKGKGCNQCFDSGYLGREAVIELVDIDETIRQVIYDGNINRLHRHLQTIHYPSFRQAAVEKVTTGVTTVEEVMRVLPHSSLHRNWLGVKQPGLIDN